MSDQVVCSQCGSDLSGRRKRLNVVVMESCTNCPHIRAESSEWHCYPASRFLCASPHHSRDELVPIPVWCPLPDDAWGKNENIVHLEGLLDAVLRQAKWNEEYLGGGPRLLRGYMDCIASRVECVQKHIRHSQASGDDTGGESTMRTLVCLIMDCLKMFDYIEGLKGKP